jgi:hypothetical protein
VVFYGCLPCRIGTIQGNREVRVNNDFEGFSLRWGVIGGLDLGFSYSVFGVGRAFFLIESTMSLMICRGGVWTSSASSIRVGKAIWAACLSGSGP